MVATISEFSIMNAVQRWSTEVAFHVAEIRLTVLIPMSEFAIGRLSISTFVLSAALRSLLGVTPPILPQHAAEAQGRDAASGLGSRQSLHISAGQAVANPGNLKRTMKGRLDTPIPGFHASCSQVRTLRRIRHRVNLSARTSPQINTGHGATETGTGKSPLGIPIPCERGAGTPRYIQGKEFFVFPSSIERRKNTF
jgi:hypothetical protein